MNPCRTAWLRASAFVLRVQVTVGKSRRLTDGGADGGNIGGVDGADMFREMLPDKLLDGDKGSGGGAGGSGGKSTTDEGTLFKTVVMVVTDPTWSSAGEPATRVCCMPVTTLAEQAA